MLLARMIAIDEDAIICDLAETYGIYDYKLMPPLKVAIFCIGLREESRIKRKMLNQEATYEQIMLADIRDKLSLLWWSKTKDAQKNMNKPQLILETIIPRPKNHEIVVFKSGKEFEESRIKLLGGTYGN